VEEESDSQCVCFSSFRSLFLSTPVDETDRFPRFLFPTSTDYTWYLLLQSLTYVTPEERKSTYAASKGVPTWRASEAKEDWAERFANIFRRDDLEEQEPADRDEDGLTMKEERELKWAEENEEANGPIDKNAMREFYKVRLRFSSPFIPSTDTLPTTGSSQQEGQGQVVQGRHPYHRRRRLGRPRCRRLNAPTHLPPLPPLHTRTYQHHQNKVLYPPRHRRTLSSPTLPGILYRSAFFFILFSFASAPSTL
jgi:hypothetical protein